MEFHFSVGFYCITLSLFLKELWVNGAENHGVDQKARRAGPPQDLLCNHFTTENFRNAVLSLPKIIRAISSFLIVFISQAQVALVLPPGPWSMLGMVQNGVWVTSTMVRWWCHPTFSPFLCHVFLNKTWLLSLKHPCILHSSFFLRDNSLPLMSLSN